MVAIWMREIQTNDGRGVGSERGGEGDGEVGGGDYGSFTPIIVRI